MTVSTRSLRRLPWGLLGMLALVAGAERYFARHSLDYTRPEYQDWRANGKAARTKARGRDLLIFGTSMTQQGLLPRILCEKTGGSAYNLSVCAGQASSSYFLLKRAIDAGANPRAILVDFHPQYLATSYLGAAPFWPDLLEPREALDLFREARDPTFLASNFVARLLPSVKDRLQIRLAIGAALRGDWIDLRGPSLLYAHNKAANDGALVYPPNPAFRGDVAAPFAQAFLPASWAPDPINARYVRRFLALAASRGIRVYWVIPPLSPELQERRDRSGLDVPYTAFIRAMQGEFANLAVLDARKSGFANGVFNDAAHLDGYGAIALSEAVGEVLASADRRESSRWVELPSFHASRPERHLPDLKDSEIAVRARGAIRQ